MTKWKEVKRIAHANPNYEVSVLEGPQGLCRYESLAWQASNGEAADDGLWVSVFESGLFESADAAEADARAAVDPIP